MVRTYGLTHLSLSVLDPERSLRFYEQVFGVREYFRDSRSIMVQGPGPHDVIAFEKRDKSGNMPPGGIRHFGFRLVEPQDMEIALQEVERAGGTVLKHGEFSPGFPYAYVTDPDGYKIEIWYE